MKNFCIMGIDPGISGAISFYFPGHPEVVTAEDVPTVNNEIDGAGLADRIRQFLPDIAIIELVGAMPGQGVSSMFKFGKAFGVAIGVCQSLNVPVEFVSPAKWKRYFGLTAEKEAAREKALNLWPASARNFQRKKDHGRAEAALLARYCAETNPTIRLASARGAAGAGASAPAQPAAE